MKIKISPIWFFSTALLLGCVMPQTNQQALHKDVFISPQETLTSPSSEPVSVQAENDIPNEIAPASEEDLPNSLPNEKARPYIDEALSFCAQSQELWEKGDPQGALRLLDQAYALILKIDKKTQPDLIKEKEKLRLMISKRIIEIYTSRKNSISGHRRAIPVVMNSHVEAEIQYLLKGSFFKTAYQRSGKYRDQIEEALKKAGLPPELSWLPLIESGYNVRALSPARALGLWQFIPSTGYKYNLKRDTYIDERMDPVKSTQAAIAYLKELHQMFGDWATVLAAYNCGEARVLSVIRSQSINYLDDFWDLYTKLPKETARYVPMFLATLHILDNKEKYGLNALQPESPLEYETVAVTKQISLKTASDYMDIPHNQLIELNPELRQDVLPENKYDLRVPVGKGEMLLSKQDEIPETTLPPQAVEAAYAYHRMKKGESLSTVASHYGCDVKELMRVNNLSRQNYIVAGKIIKVPRGEQDQKAPVAASISKRKHSRDKNYVVKKGDSLWSIAKKHGTTTGKIRKLNKLSNAKLDVGQVITIPET
jgi:membrane-bound lytic murein transglycosylase D